MIEHKCPGCGAAMSLPDSVAGGTETCPECGRATTIPEAGGAVVALAATPVAGLSRRGLFIVCIAVGAVLAAVVVAWVFVPGSLGSVLEYAPPEAVGLVHIDVRMAAEDVFKELREHKDDLGEVSEEDLAEIEEIVSKIDSLDLFFVPKGDERSRSDEPEIVGVFRTSLTPDEIMKLLQKFGVRPSSLKETGNGRYDATRGRNRIIYGAEADDLDEGIVLVGTDRVLTDKFVAELGTGDNSKLRKLFVGVDTSTPAWGAIAMDFVDEADAPRMMVGSLDPRGGGSGEVVMTFKGEKHAKKFMRDIADEDDFPLADVFEATRDGVVVTMEVKGEGSLVGRILSTFVRRRRSSAQRWEESRPSRRIDPSSL